MSRQFHAALPETGEVLVNFDELVAAHENAAYRARACGGKAGDGTRRWHGWLEFLPVNGGPMIRTPRETTQRNREDTAMWATKLSHVYLDGALQRALVRSRTHIAPKAQLESPSDATTGFAR